MPSARVPHGTFLVVGGDSEIGAAVLRHLASSGQPAIGTTRRKESLGSDRLRLDLADFDERWAPPAGTVAACICAARARLPDCAADPLGTSFVNVDQTTLLAQRLSQIGVYTLFLSSNQVFDGQHAFVPSQAPVCPISEYGSQKATAEAQIMAACAEGGGAGVLRLSKVLGPATPTMARWATSIRSGIPVEAFPDMVLAPLPIDLVAAAVCHLMFDAAMGVFQLSGPQDVSYAEFARLLVGALDGSPELVREVSAASADLPVGSIPRHTTLDSTELGARCGIVPPDAPATARLLAYAFSR